jgi:signal transduction histidine kinase
MPRRVRSAWILATSSVRALPATWVALAARMAWAALALAVLPWPVFARAAATDGGPPAAVTLRSARAAPGAGHVFPAGGTASEVVLPDEWACSRPGFTGSLWYRVPFERPAAPPAGETLALAIAHVCAQYEVVLNGTLVGSSGSPGGPVAHNCHDAVQVVLPAALLKAGANTLDIKVTGVARAEVGSRWRAGGLSALTIGPPSALGGWQLRQASFAFGAEPGASAMLLLLGGFMFVLGFVHREDSHLAYFGALALGLAIVDMRLWLPHLRVGHQAFEFLLVASLGFVAWAAVQFLLRYAGARWRVADTGLPLQCGAIAASLLLAGPERLGAMALLWQAVLALEVAAAATFHLRRRRGTASGRLMALSLAVVLLALGTEAWAQWRPAFVPPPPLAPLLLPAAMVLMGLRLVQQRGRASQQAEISRAQLEQRVREASAEIERNFRQLAELKVEQVTERERKRIAADLHDDLGAKLLTIVHTSESERISTLAREALEEMRLSVRGLTGKPVQLSDALGDWRAEVIARLAQAGIEVEWSAPDELPQPLSSRVYVQTTRILREATSNIIKHSNATHCAVQCAVAEGDFLVVIRDNGEGIAPEVDGRLDRGHGLSSMKNRAKALHGQCLVESGPGYGTVIRLTVPLDRAATPS